MNLKTNEAIYVGSVVCALAILSAGCDSQSTSQQAKVGLSVEALGRPELVIPKAVDLGVLPKGKGKFSQGIMIENRGSANLIARNFVSGCGCAVPDGSGLEIPPGETGMLTVALQVNRPGFKEADLQFETNDPRQPVARLSVHWSVESIISFGQEGWDAGAFRRNASLATELAISDLRQDISSVTDVFFASFDPELQGINCRLTDSGLEVSGDLRNFDGVSRVDSNIVIQDRQSKEVVLSLPFRLYIQEEPAFWPARCDVEYTDNGSPHVHLFVNGIANISELAFVDEDEKPISYEVESEGTTEFLLRVILDSTRRSSRITPLVEEKFLLDGGSIEICW